jgi:RNA polymerase subunit RPABC4/transcription elongation factor Spt4
MNTGAILTGLALLVVAIPFVFSPFLRNERRKSRLAPRQNVDLEKRKTDALLALSDLDFDYRTGKVTQEDYEILRAQLVTEAGSLIETVRQEREEIEKRNLAQTIRQEKDEIEKLIRARQEIIRKDKICAHCGRALRPLNQYCPGCGTALGKACPMCGKKVGLSDQFCPGCGSQL